MKKDKTSLRWKLIEFPLKGLIEWDSNPVKISKRDLNELAKSIKRFNQDLPYVAAQPPGKSKKIPLLDGHQRKRAEVEINKKSVDDLVPVLVPNRALTESEKKEWVIRHRRNTGQFDFDILKEKFLAVNLMEWGFEQEELEITGYEFDGKDKDAISKEGKEYDESIADAMSLCKCEKCGNIHAKKD